MLLAYPHAAQGFGRHMRSREIAGARQEHSTLPRFAQEAGEGLAVRLATPAWLGEHRPDRSTDTIDAWRRRVRSSALVTAVGLEVGCTSAC